MSNPKIKTIDLKGKAYAQVKDRLAEFRKDNPRGLIETHPDIKENGSIIFKARIVKDKSDENSAEATGHSMGNAKDAKAFEKLETIAVGRALALLGYAVDGEIASSEEMEEFEDYKKTQREATILAIQERVDSITDIDELREYYKMVRGNGAEVEAYIMEKVKTLKEKSTKKTK